MKRNIDGENGIQVNNSRSIHIAIRERENFNEHTQREHQR